MKSESTECRRLPSVRFTLAFKNGTGRMGQGAWSSISLTFAPSPLVQTRGQLTFVECKEGAEALRWIGTGVGGELKGHFSTLGQSNKSRCSLSHVNYHEDPLNIKELVLGC